MSPNLAALLYLVAGVLFILALRGLSSPESSRRGNLFGMIGMAHRRRHHARRHPPADAARLGAGRRRHRHRRRHRRGDRRARADDLDAGTGRRLPLAGRHGGGAGGGGRLLRAGGLRHRQRRPHPPAEPDRNVARRRHRRHHLHRLGDRVPEAVRPHERQADHAAGPPRHQHRARRWRWSSSSTASTLHQSAGRLLADRRAVARARRPDHHPDRRRRHAGRDLDAQLLFGLGGRRHRLHARQFGADHHRRAGRLVRRDPVLHHVQGHEPLVHLGHPRRLRRRGGGPGGRRRRSSGRSSSARPRTPPTS